MNNRTISTPPDCPFNIEGLIQLEQEAIAPVIKWTKLCNIGLIPILLICLGVFFYSSGDIEIQIGAIITFFITMVFIVFNIITIREFIYRPQQILMSLNIYESQLGKRSDNNENNT